VIWAILLLLGVPLWLCALGITGLVVRNRALRQRPGNVPVRLRTHENERWHAGHGVWVHDVFAFRGSPAGWKEALVWAAGAASRPATAAERRKLHRIGDDPVVVTLALHPRGTIQVAARAEHAATLVAPFADQITPRQPAAAR
jgi:hypothetical protein